MEFGISNLNRNDDATGGVASEPFGESIEDIIARGAAAASASEPESAPEPGDVLITDKPKRGRKKKPLPDEAAAAQAAAELEVFFTPEGIGTVFTNGLTAFYVACGAPPLTPEEQPMLASVFAKWAKFRLPASASRYQPDLLLAACLAMATLPRMQPIAKTTVPFWRRVFGVFRRKKATPGNG